MFIASICEFSGAVSVGSRVSDTIRTNVIQHDYFKDHPSVLLLAMMCTLIGSSTFLTIATRHGFPVSTTHSIMGGILGASTAAMGMSDINWGIHGVSQVFVAWVAAPGIAGVLGTILFLLTKNIVLAKKNAAKMALYTVPFYTFITVAAVSMLIALHGIQFRKDLSKSEILGSVFGTASTATILCVVFLMPYMWRKILYEDWTLRWYDMWRGPFLLRLPPPPPMPIGYEKAHIKDYYRGYLTPEELASIRASQAMINSVRSGPNDAPDLECCDAFSMMPPTALSSTNLSTDSATAAATSASLAATTSYCPESDIPPRPPGSWLRPAVLLWRTNRILLRGVEKDVVRLQKMNSVMNWDIADMHSRAPRFDNRAEHMYSFVQILTAAAASFTHGANDVSNSVAPLTTAYRVWQSGRVQPEVGVPLWILVLGGACIVLGLLTYGYHVIRNLGNRLTLMSPSRGFCMELSSAATVLMATKFGIPVSTTQCITGATVGVGLANGDWRCINYKLVAWIYFGWMVTLPVTAIISGTIMGVIMNAPRWETGI
ncbi:Phosphate-repressible phosphate permease [Ceratocystis platani]|uniref:Phosphate transporter n=1 Tax=Ceratocystis fimbriata f. sp. platani TaxID=88771 RepID=A0A0F8DIU0_CERFI|nr:Phosphate-repressible phosphate permease [Ceratocystis platani]